MSESKSGKKRHRKNPAKQARDLSIRSDAAQGMTHAELHERYGLSRQQFTRILTSDETKALVKEQEDRVKRLLSRAVDMVEKALDAPIADPVGMKAALSVLETYGLIKKNVDLTHRFPKPLVIKRRDGSEVVAGTEADLKEKE